MMAITEAIGMALPGASSIPAADANHARMRAECGRRIVEMVWEDLTPATHADAAPFENGIAVAMAMGCSTNAIIHLVAMSRRAGFPTSASTTSMPPAGVPVIANIRPSGDTYLMEDFYYAGGLPALMRRLRAHLKADVLTVNGHTLGENIDGAEVFNDDVIRAARDRDLRRRRARRAARQPRPRRLRHQAERLRAASCCGTPARRWCSTTIRR